MEEGWKNDENPYLVIPCRKCSQYMYVKTTQKTKKCLRCGRQHKVSSILDSGEIVKGMTNAVEMVKTRQNELAIRELGDVPEFRAAEDFTVKRSLKQASEDPSKILDDDNGLQPKFRGMLREISSSFKKFPYYVLEIMAENYGIPLSDLSLLVKNSRRKGCLIQSLDNYYTIDMTVFNNELQNSL